MQKEYIGFNSIYELSNVLESYDAKNILIVTGKKSFQKCGVNVVLLELLSGRNFKIIINEFSTNPKYYEIVNISDKIKELDFDVILAVGGGSVIDFAKSLNVKLNNYKNFKSIVVKNEKIENSLLLIAIPTTAGTGSEATQFSVIYVGDKKYSLSNPNLKPDVAIVDPKFTYNLPPFYYGMFRVGCLLPSNRILLVSEVY